MIRQVLDEDVLALAGLYQAVDLVRQTARSGSVEPAAFRASVASIFRFDAEDVPSVWGGLPGLRHGLQILTEQLRRDGRRRDPELTGYAATLMYLERKLVRLPWMMDTLRQEIDAAARIAEKTAVEDPPVLANLAHAYGQTISRLSPRILVHGEPEHLKNTEIANRIRALLLAGMRAAVLWRQVGGSRLKLLFRRKRIVAGAEATLRLLEKPANG